MENSPATGPVQENETQTKVTIRTTRFGEVEVNEDLIIDFPEGILGFPEEKSFAILEHRSGSPFWWLQSLKTPELAFVMMNPLLVRKDYLKELPASERKLFEGDQGKQMVLFAFVTIPRGQVEKMTINLLGPIVIDVKKRRGRQLVLANSGLNTRHPVFSEMS